MKPHWFTIAALTVGILTLFLMPAFLNNNQGNIALLEQLAPRIERAAVLAPGTREAIVQLVDRVRNAPADPRLETRRAIALERIAGALAAKDPSSELSSVGRRMDGETGLD